MKTLSRSIMSYLQVKTILEIECVAKGDDNQIDL